MISTCYYWCPKDINNSMWISLMCDLEHMSEHVRWLTWWNIMWWSSPMSTHGWAWYPMMEHIMMSNYWPKGSIIESWYVPSWISWGCDCEWWKIPMMSYDVLWTSYRHHVYPPSWVCGSLFSELSMIHTCCLDPKGLSNMCVSLRGQHIGVWG